MKRGVCFLLLMVSLVSCNNDDDNSSLPLPEPEVSILGKWYYKDIIINDEVIPYDDHESCGKDYIEFYDVDKIRAIDVWNCEEDLDWEANFFKTNDMLTLVEDGITTTVEIVELSATKLSYTYTTDWNEDGVEDTVIENFDR